MLKFGGSSLGNADCLRRAARLVAAAVQRRGPSVVVASAMSGVTDRLIEAACRSEAGDEEVHDTLAASLRRQHEASSAPCLRLRTCGGESQLRWSN